MRSCGLAASNKGRSMNMMKLAAGAAAAAMISVSGANAASEIFLSVPGIQGGAQTSGFEGQIEVFSSSLGFLNDKKCTAQQLQFVKPVDMASADILVALALGTQYPTMKLTFTRPSGQGGSLSPVMQFTFQNASFSSFNTGGSSGSGGPVEQATVKYGAVTGIVYNVGQNGVVTPEPFAVNCF